MLKRITEEIESEKEFKGYCVDRFESELNEKEMQIRRLSKERDDLKKIIEIKDKIIETGKALDRRKEEALMESLSGVVQGKDEIIEELRGMLGKKGKVDVGSSPIKVKVENKACSTEPSLFKTGPIKRSATVTQTRKMTRKK